MAEKAYLAVDIGASSGRHVAGLFDGRRVRLAEVHRFGNGPAPAAGHLYWNLLSQWGHIRAGLRAAGAAYGDSLASVGIDTWGVDFGLLGPHDELLGNPFHYRDCRTDGMLERALALVPRDEIFAQTGVQFMQINSLYQLLAMKLSDSPVLAAANRLLMMPDLFHWLLTGVKANEFTNATTTQFYNPLQNAWAAPLLEQLGLPTGMLGEILQPGAKLGPLRPDVAGETNLSKLQVVLPGTHDTASAVLAVPAASGLPEKHPAWCYISSGTWSLMGVEIDRPIVNERCLKLNFTNEGGIGGTTRLLKNIAGLWLVQECRRIWNQSGQDYRWEDLNQLSAAAPPLASLVDPDDPELLAPAHMPQALQAFCRRTGQTVPENPGAILRSAIESLALKYRQVLTSLEELIGNRIEVIHIVGGGVRNQQLCQAAADACQRPVIAGPIEATALGNVLMQAVAAGDFASISQARQAVRESFEVEHYEPHASAAWDEAYDRFSKLAQVRA